MKPIRMTEAIQTEELLCPNCGQVNDAASGIIEITRMGNPEIKPKPGDLSICINCGHFSIFSEELKLREMTDRERRQWAGNPILVQTSEALAKLKRKN